MFFAGNIVFSLGGRSADGSDLQMMRLPGYEGVPFTACAEAFFTFAQAMCAPAPLFLVYGNEIITKKE